MEDKDLKVSLHILDAMSDYIVELENAYNKKDLKNFKKIKQHILDLNNKISENMD